MCIYEFSVNLMWKKRHLYSTNSRLLRTHCVYTIYIMHADASYIIISWKIIKNIYLPAFQPVLYASYTSSVSAPCASPGHTTGVCERCALIKCYLKCDSWSKEPECTTQITWHMFVDDENIEQETKQTSWFAPAQQKSNLQIQVETQTGGITDRLTWQAHLKSIQKHWICHFICNAFTYRERHLSFTVHVFSPCSTHHDLIFI